MTRRIFLACTGAGAGAQQELWKVPGCSAYFAGAAFPYGEDQTTDFLGFRPERFCSRETAIDLAMAAYQRAWDGHGCEAIGVGLTATVASTREHRGGHRVHAAVMTAGGVRCQSLTLPKGVGDAARHRDGVECDLLAVRLATAPEGFPDATAEAWARFFERPLWTVTGARQPASELEPRPVLFPGAFNPPHAGHLEPARAAGATFSVCADAPHKPRLSLADLLHRAKMLRGHRVLFSEGDPLYLDKARRHRAATFIIGADALQRMLDPKWGPDPTAMLAELAQLDARFLVLSRVVSGEFLAFDAVLERAGVHCEYTSLFKPLPGRWDVSSTELRKTA
jgi:nicotinic acid mononucleotide adenylyltransferase/nicotinamide mononucleotide (NMN) deamidase PncC